MCLGYRPDRPLTLADRVELWAPRHISLPASKVQARAVQGAPELTPRESASCAEGHLCSHSPCTIARVRGLQVPKLQVCSVNNSLFRVVRH